MGKWMSKGELVVITILLFLAAVSLGNSSYAGEDGADEEERRAFPLDGSVEYKNYSYFEEAEQDGNQIVNELILKLEFDGSFGETIRYYLEPRLRVDDDSLSKGVIDGIKDDTPKRRILDVEEGFLKFESEVFDVTAGKLIYAWGTADGYNPTDNLNPRDYTDLLDNEKIGVFSAMGNYYLRDFDLQFVFVPVFTPSRVFPTDSRWAFVPPGFPLPINERDLPPDTLANAQFAFRCSTTIKGWDFSLSYYDGIEDAPVGLVEFADATPTGVTPTYNKIRVPGGDFSTTFGKWEIHGELGYFISDDDGLDSYLQYVVGFNYSWSDLVLGHDVTLILEYAGETITNEGDDPAFIDTEISRVFTNSVLSRVIYEIDYYTKFEFLGAFNFDDDDFYIQTKFFRDLSESLKIEAGFDILQGPRDTFFGQFKDNDRFFCSLEYLF